MIYKLNGIGYDSNTYLMVGKKNILIDPGTPNTFKLLKDKISNIAKDIDYVINTHCHYDHTGSDYLYEEYFNAPVIIHNLEVDDLKNNTNTTVSGLFGKELISPKEIIPINEISEELKKWDIEIIETPGHTRGSISIIYKDNLITGDTLFAYGVGRWDFPTGSLVDLRSSISKLERIAYERNIVNILPGHGENGNLSAFSNAKLFL
ncbi:MBL fold metallo-hydrolase [Methanothermococcus okinawensis]|uniref:Beta-lactamase domain-containing protein n=1 Tax=Methanothermococcus okinawensis (strain DSM 14208 / JCM 11175 / IH1) TaxID=647113 RepID=F8AMR8_METOI|nr:MBL fold metallo-hydrolase [Methanothermococcus okinawensis]AEH06899.1 beta-lactamase domain-containing protein [Methanothermococcus okinawensis IH1]